MKYTKEQRQKIYKKVHNLVSIDDCAFSHLCLHFDNYTNNMFVDFPELYLLFPIEWVGYLDVLENHVEDEEPYAKEIRKIMLEFCIEMTK